MSTHSHSKECHYSVGPGFTLDLRSICNFLTDKNLWQQSSTSICDVVKERLPHSELKELQVA